MLQTIYHTEEAEGYKSGDLDKFWTSDEDRIFVAKDKTVVGFLSVEVYHENEDYIYLNDYTLYVVEDITGTHTDPYHYKLYFHTEFPVTVEEKP